MLQRSYRAAMPCEAWPSISSLSYLKPCRPCFIHSTWPHTGLCVVSETCQSHSGSKACLGFLLALKYISLATSPFCISSNSAFSMRPLLAACPYLVQRHCHCHSQQFFSALHMSFPHGPYPPTYSIICILVVSNGGTLSCSRSHKREDFCLFCSLTYPGHLGQ